MTCPLFCDLCIALIGKELYSALCFLVLLKKSLTFSSFFSSCFWFLNAVSILLQNFYGICGGSGFAIAVVAV